MSEVCRQGDIASNHDDCPATPVVTYSSNVIVNGVGVARVTDHPASHGCPVHPAHTRTITTGDGTVIVNGLKIAKIGSQIDCGGTMITGSPDVIAGGPLE